MKRKPAYEAGPIDASEPGVAALLAQALSDDAWWQRFAACPDDQEWRDSLAARALELYRQTVRIIQPRASAVASEPVDRAAAILREIADACAVQSHRWTVDERAGLRIPTRAQIERAIRAHDLDGWARGLGCPLALGKRKVTKEPWRSEGEASKAALAAQFSTAVTLYERVLEAREVPRAWSLLAADVFRRAACREIGVARGLLNQVRGQLEPGAEPVAYATLLMIEMFFVASRAETPDEPLFPGAEYLRELLFWSGGSVWLASEDVKLPEWLTNW